jgi:hypothetical protein
LTAKRDASTTTIGQKETHLPRVSVEAVMRAIPTGFIVVFLATGPANVVQAQSGRNYRLTATDLKQRVIPSM